MKGSKVNAKERIKLLREEIERHNRLYYVDNKPVITDFEYDLLMQELQYLESKYPAFQSEDSPTLKIGSDLSNDNDGKNFPQYRHKTPMLSLGNTYNLEELYSFDEKLSKISGTGTAYVCELKIDGSAISLTYNNHRLVRAVTRGDGTIGDDVTNNVKQIKSIPLELPSDSFQGEFEIRGEIFMSWNSFDKLNKKREDAEEPTFANPRNAAAGSLKLIDPTLMAERNLSAYFYSVNGEGLRFKTHAESLEWARNIGFPVSEHYKLCYNLEEVFQYLDDWDKERKTLDFPTDGVVIKANSTDLQLKAGYTAKSPRWATAYKFKAEQAVTIIESIDYQTGRTGAVTPVANLRPVLLSGSTIRRASLHNEDQMKLLDIHIGDTVYVEKGGEIIPKIVGVDLSLRKSGSLLPRFPSNCPECGSLLRKEESEAKHYCPNYNGCPMQIRGRFLHFCSRKAMNILAGEATIDQMIRLGMIKELPDLYSLTQQELLKMDGWKERSAERFLKSVELSKSVPYHRVLYALGIRHVGETTAKSLAMSFKSMEALMDTTRDELLMVDEIGGIVADSIISFFSDTVNRLTVKRLGDFGLNMSEERAEQKAISNKLEGLSVVVSGVFSKPREEIKQIIEQHSGKNVSSISASTSFIVAGQNMGPAKEEKAKKLGIKILTEEEFFNLIK